MPLILDTGCSSHPGRLDINEDVCLSVDPDAHHLNPYGALFAIADGMSGQPDGREAARCAIKTLRECYYSTLDGRRLEHAIKESFAAANQAVRTEGESGRASTLTALILRNRRWAVGHAGNTRIYLYRDDELKQLTHDHIVPHMALGSLVTRGCGLDEEIKNDFYTGELAEDDIFILTSDGLHNILTGAIMVSCLLSNDFAKDMAAALVQRAQECGANGNTSACVIRVEKLPKEIQEDLVEQIANLKIRAQPNAGETVDGFRVEGLIHKGRMSRLYKARDLESGESVVLKFPITRYGDDPEYIDHFLREEWIGGHLQSPYLIEFLSLKPGRRTALYSVMSYNKGENLARRIRRKRGLSVRESLSLAKQLLTALEHLHRKGIIHRDVKPDNILVERKTRKLRLVDLGLSHIERWQDHATRESPVGTPSYMAPELFTGGTPDERADVYSAGVTLYHMLTRKYPYGTIDSLNDAEFSRYVPVEQYNPDIPIWLARVIEKACAFEPGQRFQNAVDFANALVARRTESASAASRLPLIQRIPILARWKLLFAVSLLVNLAIFLILALR